MIKAEQEVNLSNALANWLPFNLHLIGKDILRFHAVYWPAMLMSAELPIPERVFGHGFITKDGLKMGKSLGNTLDPFALVDKYGADAVRYYFIKAIELGKDGDFSELRFIEVLNADLANNLGNLLNRTLGMLKKYCQGNCPQLTAADYPETHPLKLIGQQLGDKVIKAYETLQFKYTCEEIFALINAGNKYIDDSAPWSLFKQGKQKEVELILYAVLESVRLSAYLLSPIIPNLSNDIYQQLGFNLDFNNKTQINQSTIFEQHSQWGKLPANSNLGKARPIFAKIELPEDV